MIANEIDYDVMEAGGDLIGVRLAYRRGRVPISKAQVQPSGVVFLYGADGMVEAMGSATSPCPLNVIDALRTHPDGLLIVEFTNIDSPTKTTDVPIGEQMIKDVLSKR